MPWFKVDDTLSFHAKVVAAGNAAMGLWLRAGSWSAQQLTEGFIPDHMVSAMNGTKSAPTLVQVRLWDRVDGGYAFRGWGDYQPSKSSVEAEREASRLRQQRARDKAKEKRDATLSQRDVSAPSQPRHAVSHAVTQPLVTVPPTRPDPTNRKNATSSKLDDEFTTFWSAYPKKVDKGHAVKAWAKALKKTEASVIISAAERFAKESRGGDRQFIANPATWLNGERWADEAAPPAPAPVYGPPRIPDESELDWEDAS